MSSHRLPADLYLQHLWLQRSSNQCPKQKQRLFPYVGYIARPELPVQQQEFLTSLCQCSRVSACGLAIPAVRHEHHLQFKRRRMFQKGYAHKLHVDVSLCFSMADCNCF